MVVYKIINKINNKIYIGKDKFNDPNYLGSGILIKKAIEKYGKSNFVKVILFASCDRAPYDEKLDNEFIVTITRPETQIIYFYRYDKTKDSLKFINAEYDTVIEIINTNPEELIIKRNSDYQPRRR